MTNTLGGLMSAQASATLAAGEKMCLTFRAPASGALQGVGIYMHGVSAPVGTLSIYNSNSNGFPTGTALESASAQFVNYSVGYTTFSGSLSLNAGTVYCAVLEMSSGTSQPCITGISSISTAGAFYQSGVWWSRQPCAGASMALRIAGNNYGSRVGRLSNIDLTSNALYNVSGTRVARLGALIRPDVSVTLHGVEGWFWRYGSPTATMKCEIYTGGTLVASSITNALASTLGTSGGAQSDRAFLFNDVQLSANTLYNIVYIIDGFTGNDSTNYVVARGHGSMHTSCFPSSDNNVYSWYLGGVWSTSVSITSDSNWTYYKSSGQAFPAVYLYGSQSSGGGLLVNPGLNGGLIQI